MSVRKRMPSYRIWGATVDGAIEFESLTTETFEPALQIIRDYFFRDENVSRCVGLDSDIGGADELIELCKQAAKDGVSVVAVDATSNGKVVGVAFNKIQIAGNPTAASMFEEFSRTCKYDSSKSLVDFMIDVDSRFNLFKYYNVDCILEIMFLATAKEYRRRRIGELLVASSMEIGHELNRGKDVKVPVEIWNDDSLSNQAAVPALCSLIATSDYTAKIADKFGFSRHVSVSFKDFEFRGKKFSETADNECSILCAKRIDKS